MRKRKAPTPTMARVAALLSYDPTTGLFTRKVAISQCKVGDIAGTLTASGYISISIDDYPEYGHQLAWLLTTGKWPDHQIDHRDLDGANNRWANLRPATMSEQQQNSRVCARNRSGVKGVCWCAQRGKWRAYITLAGRQHHLGHFTTISAAAAARRGSAEKLHGTFARHA